MPLNVQLTDVVRQYQVGGNKVNALNGLTVQIDGGEFTSIVGPSGAGKSTLLHLLGALDSPDSGSVCFNDVEIGTMTDDQQSTFRRHQVGFIFQFFNLLPTLTAWENVAMPMLLEGKRLRSVRSEALELLKLVGLSDRIDHRPAELSGGQMQRVAVARALMMDPPLILADEPTGNLDSATGASILELLRNVAHGDGADRAVVMVTHNLEAAAYTDRVITLQDGALKSDESPWWMTPDTNHVADPQDPPTEVIHIPRDRAHAPDLFVAETDRMVAAPQRRATPVRLPADSERRGGRHSKRRR